jgi:uncharacterized membrane protein
MTVEASPPRRRAGERWLWAALLVAYAALIVPILIVDTPPLLDYSNHNARLWMIAGGARLPPLDQFYAIDWSRASTNIGIDLMAAGLGPLIGKTLVGPLCLTLAIVLPCLGALLLHRRVFGAPHWWQLAFVFPAFGKTVLGGFMNFHIGIGVALVAATLDDRLARRGPLVAFVGRTLLTAFTLVFHPFAAMAYGGLLAGLAIGRDVAPLMSWSGLKAKVGPVLLAAAPSLVPVILVVLFSPHPPVEAGSAAKVLQWNPFTLQGALGDLLVAFHSYSEAFDLLAVALVVAVAGLALLVRKLSIHAGLLLVGLGFAALTLVMPTRFGDGSWLQYRPAVAATFILLVAVRPDFAVSRRALALCTSLFFALAVGRTGLVGAAWVSAQQDIRSLRQALDAVPEGAAVLSVTREASDEQRKAAPLGRYFGKVPAYWGYPPLAVAQRHAYVPTLFAIAGQQPLRVRDPWSALTSGSGDRPVNIKWLGAARQKTGEEYLTRWKSFDYVMLLNADAPAAPGEQFSPADVQLVSDQGFAVLYRIRKAPAR